MAIWLKNGGAGKLLGRPVNSTVARLSRKNETPIAEMSTESFGADLSGRYAKRSMVTPMMTVSTIAQTTAKGHGSMNMTAP